MPLAHCCMYPHVRCCPAPTQPCLFYFYIFTRTWLKVEADVQDIVDSIMAYCNICAKLTIDDVSNTDFRFHPNVKSLKQGADNKCPLCTLCFTRLQAENERQVISDLLEGKRPNQSREGIWYHSIWLHGEFVPVEHNTGSWRGESSGGGVWISVGRFRAGFNNMEETNISGFQVTARLSCYA